MGGSQSRVAHMGLAGGGAAAVGPRDALAGIPATRGPGAPGTVNGGGPPADGQVLV